MKLSDRYRTALVTGAGTGLGAAFVAMLIDEGVTVWGTSRDPARLERPTFRPIPMELADPASVDSAWERAQSESGGIDLLINNAGSGMFGGFAGGSAETWEQQISLLLLAPAALCRHAAQAMSRRAVGAIVNVSSLAAEFPIPYMSGYSASKAALSSLSCSLLLEAGDSGLTVIDFRPGDYRTGFNTTMEVQSRAIPATGRATRVWRVLQANIASAPQPERAARDLCRALKRGRSGVVRSGGCFQAYIAPFLDRFASGRMRLAGMRRFFHLG